MFEPPSPAMSMYFFMRRLRRRWSPLASRRGGDWDARAEPEQRRATHREDRELEIEGGEPVHDAVPEVRPRGLPESRLARAHGPDGRKRPPHVLLTSASSSRVTTVSPRPRAYA